jgi:hypothetical protein
MSINTIDDAIGCCVTPNVLWTLRVGGWLTATELMHDVEFSRRLVDIDGHATSHMYANSDGVVVLVQTKSGRFNRLLFFYIGTDEEGDHGICAKAGPPEADRPEPPVVRHRMASGRVARGSDSGAVFISDVGSENATEIRMFGTSLNIRVMASTKCGRTLFVAFRYLGEWEVWAVDTLTKRGDKLLRDYWDGAALVGVGWCDMTDRLFVCSGGRIVTIHRPKKVPYPVFTGLVYKFLGRLCDPCEFTLYSDGIWGPLTVCGRSRITTSWSRRDLVLDCPPDTVAVNGRKARVSRVRDWTRALIATREAIRRQARSTKRDLVLRIHGLGRMPAKKKKALVPYSYTCTPRPACDHMRALSNFHTVQTAVIANNKTAGGGKVVPPSILQLIGKYTLLS